MDTMPQMTLPEAPQWSLLLGVAGRSLVWVAVATLVLSAVAWLLAPRSPRLRGWGAAGFAAGCFALFGTLLILGVLFGSNRLEFEYVWAHGDGSNTLPYRIAGIWSGQEGSFLLWACCAALFGLLAVRGTGAYRRWYTIVYSVFLASIAGILAYESPFNLNMLGGVPVVPQSGIGLSPSLQNYWVTIHPPTIFLGFGALTVLAAYAFAALATGMFHDWAVMVRPWAILASTLVGLGLCMGGFWAYETLGWGGFWMWDPVENVSFVPWVLCLALVHGLMVQIARQKWVISNLLMGALPFLLFVYGTFLTRSGALSETSVHSFAEMDRFAHKLLLGFTVGSTLGFIGLWIWRALQFRRAVRPERDARGVSREGLLRIGAILLVALGLATAVGMSVPMFMALSGRQPMVVEENIYHRILVWVFVPLMVVMAITPLLPWRGMAAAPTMKRLYGVLCVTLILLGGCMAAIAAIPWLRGIGEDNYVRTFLGWRINIVPWVLGLVTICLAVVVASFWRVAELFRRSKLSAAAFLSHVGVALLMVGLIVSRGFERHDQVVVQEGVHAMGLGYLVTYQGRTNKDEFDRNNKVKFELRSASEKFIAMPGLYSIRAGDGTIQTMVWPHIERHVLHDIYFVPQPPVTDISDDIVLQPGETAKMDRLTVKFVKNTRVGDPGAQGTRFGAQLEVTDGPHKFQATPAIEIGPKGNTDHPATVARDFVISLVGMDVASGAVTLKLSLARPIYRVDLFYKPLTALVWGGTGIFALSGLVAAYYRRRPKADAWASDAAAPH